MRAIVGHEQILPFVIDKMPHSQGYIGMGGGKVQACEIQALGVPIDRPAVPPVDLLVLLDHDGQKAAPAVVRDVEVLVDGHVKFRAKQESENLIPVVADG